MVPVALWQGDPTKSVFRAEDANTAGCQSDQHTVFLSGLKSPAFGFKGFVTNGRG
jgi:hypothetical protein